MTTKALLFGTSLAVAAVLAPWTAAAAEYSADWSMETAEGAFKGRIYATAAKERREIGTGGDATVMVTRRDKKLMFTLMPSERMYMESKLGEGGAADDLEQYDVEQSVVGEEVISGVRTTKSKVILKDKPPKSGKMGGFWWTTREGIVVKIDAISIDKKSKDRLKMELANLKVGAQDPRLFEIPAGYSKMDDAMPALDQMKSPARERGRSADEKKSERAGAPGSGLGDSLRDALKLLK